MRNVFRLLCTLLAACLLFPAQAQRPAFGKMSSLVREACRATLADAGPAWRTGRQDARTLIAFVKLAGEDTAALSGRGCKVLARVGRLCVAEIPLPQIASLSLDPRVQRIEAGRLPTVQMDTVRVVTAARAVNEGVGLPQGYTGEGVVVGVQDIGFDLTHPNFWSADMQAYRIKRLWDMLSYDTLQSALPVGRDYTTQAELLALGRPRDGDAQTHGTHTAGIAAGSGAEGGGVVSPYRGIAYGADLCLVCNATSDDKGLIDPKDYYKYTYALDALGFKYIFDYADAVGKPCVINFSEGSQQDFRGDDQLYYEMLDALVGPGHIIVSSAGNWGGSNQYLRKAADEPYAGTRISPYGHYGVQSVATTRSRGDFTMRLTVWRNDHKWVAQTAIPLGRVLASADSTYTDTLRAEGGVYVLSASAYRSCYDPADIVCDWTLSTDTVAQAALHPRSLELVGEGVEVEMFPVTAFFYSGDETHGVCSPGSAPCVISVGSTDYRTDFTNWQGTLIDSYRHGTDGERDYTSSVGPTWDGRVKPNVMAPGHLVISSYSSWYVEHHPDARDVMISDVRHFDYNGRTYAWNANSGTSMSSPVVAGIIALWLQAYPRLTPQDCLDIFAKTCTRYDGALDHPNNYYGYGQIDAAAGLRLVLEKAAAGISTLGEARADSGAIYSLSGLYVGRDATRLPRGLYVKGGRKIVIK